MNASQSESAIRGVGGEAIPKSRSHLRWPYQWRKSWINKSGTKDLMKPGFQIHFYAVWWIRQSILQALAEQSWIVRLPLNKIEASIKSTRLSLNWNRNMNVNPLQKRSRNPCLFLLTISKKRCVLPEDMFPWMRHSNKEKTAHWLMYLVMMISLIPMLHSLQNRSAEKLNGVLSTLTLREADVIRLYFGLATGEQPMTLEEIGERFDLTRERVRQIKEKAIRRLKHTSAARF